MSSSFNIPAGYVCVPREPTIAMIKAGADAVNNDGELAIQAAWRYMLAAAATPPQALPNAAHVEVFPGESVAMGCHCDLGPNGTPDGCVLDVGRPEDCARTRSGKITSREDCDEWKPIRLAASVASRAGMEPVAWQWRKILDLGLGERCWSEWEALQPPFMDARGLAKTDPENYEMRPVYLHPSRVAEVTAAQPVEVSRLAGTWSMADAQAWGDRHDVRLSGQDLFCAFEDAATLHCERSVAHQPLPEERIRDAFMTTNTRGHDDTYASFRDGVRFAEKALAKMASTPASGVAPTLPESEMSDASRLSLLNKLAQHRGFKNAAKALASIPLAAPASPATDASEVPAEACFTREQWVHHAQRVYVACGDSQEEAAGCAEALADEQDWHGELDEPYEMALSDIEGRPVAAPEVPAARQESGLSVEQEPKYTVNGSAIVNRASGEAIPADEPVFIFRARDKYAASIIGDYAAQFCTDPAHAAAVEARFIQFSEWADAHPERMKEPDTALAAAQAAPVAAEGRCRWCTHGCQRCMPATMMPSTPAASTSTAAPAGEVVELSSDEIDRLWEQAARTGIGHMSASLRAREFYRLAVLRIEEAE